MARRVARLNAVTHGLTAETLILPGEDPRAFQRRLDDWTAQLEPANPFEHDLVRQVATLSWRLDRADRVQDALIADSLGTSHAEQRRAEVADLGRRLLPPPRVPNFVRRFGVWADLDRLAHRGPDDPDDPPRLLLRLEATADGCRWLLDRWAELRHDRRRRHRPGRTSRWSRPSACWASGRSTPSTTSRCSRSSWRPTSWTARGPTRSPSCGRRPRIARPCTTASGCWAGGCARRSPDRRSSARGAAGDR